MQVGILTILAAAMSAPLGPSNDDCTSAFFVGVPSVTAGSTLGAGLDPGAGPGCGTSITVGGVWYSVMGTGGTMTATTCPLDDVQPGAADYNSKLSVFCGACEGLSCVTGNDNGCSFFVQSTASWCSEEGVEYLILVHGDDEQGDFDLSVYDDGTPCGDPPDCSPPVLGACCFPGGACVDADEVSCTDAGGVFQGEDTDCETFDCLSLTPENDDCTGAQAVAVPSVTEGSTVFANIDAVPFCGIFIDSPGVWYAMTGTGGTMTVTTCSSDPVQPGAANFDTQLSVYCGGCNTSDCCGPNGTPGCGDPDCQAAVCAADPFCCDVQWDAICADSAIFLCPGLCEGFFCVTGNDDGCDADFLSSTASWCTEAGRTYYVLVHGFTEQTGDFALSVYDDGVPCLNPPTCEACFFQCEPGELVEDEPNCGIPQDIVNGGCNSPIGDSNCCAPSGDPGCNDPSCTAIICDFDPFCCDQGWDVTCAAAALDLCDSCADVIYPMLPIECGQTYCSTAGANGGMRDVDWYKLQLDEDSLVEVTANCGFSALFGIVDNFGIDSCVGLEDFVSVAVSQPCEPTSVFANLPAGTWFLILAPASFDPLICQTQYELSVQCSVLGACCFDDGSCFQRDELACAADGGAYLGVGVDCFDLDGESVSETSMPNLPIPDFDPTGIVDTIEVDQSLIVGKLTVDVGITHSWLSDLDITITHQETQTSAVLWRGTCDGWLNLDVTFDDDGGDVTCAFPTVGVVAPIEVNGSPLSVFQGIDAAGTWTLHVIDTGFPDIGTLNQWTINIETGDPVDCAAPLGRCCPGCPADCADGNGMVDVTDLVAVINSWGGGGVCDIAPPGGDGTVDVSDLILVLTTWGPCPTDCAVTTSAECNAIGGEWIEGADCESDPCGP